MTVPTAPARKILAVEFLKFGADDRGQIVPIIACGASAPGKSPPTVNAAPRWIRLRAGVEQTVKPA